MTEADAWHGRWQAKADGEWYDRGWVPHRDGQGLTQAITFRLGDSLPQARLARLRVELAALDATLAAQGTASAERAAVVARERQQRILAWLDAGYGSCLLRDAPCATAVADALCHGHERDYALVAWCVMPNHVHVVVRLHEGTALGRLVKAWKSVSARRINTVRQRQGAVWARDYYDRFIRDAEHLANAVRYAEHNPVAAGLTSSADRWRWSSAWRG